MGYEVGIRRTVNIANVVMFAFAYKNTELFDMDFESIMLVSYSFCFLHQLLSFVEKIV